MNTGTIILAMLGSMMAGVLIAILIDTFYVKRWHEVMQSDREQLEEKLRQSSIEFGQSEAKYSDLTEQLQTLQRELDEARNETIRLDERRVELETRLETAASESDSHITELRQVDDGMDVLRSEKAELARQLAVAQVEMKHLQEDLEANSQKMADVDVLEAENLRLTARLELVETELDEEKAQVKVLLDQLAETERLRASLQEAQDKIASSSSQIDNMQSALGRAQTQIKHTGKSQLQIIKGIGPATERKLKTAGIVTVSDLAEETPERLLEILNMKPASLPKLEAWVAEAQQLAPTFGEALA